MKKILLAGLMMMLAFFAHAQNKDYKVVFDMTSKDPASQQSLLREINLIKTANPGAWLEVVLYGQSLDMVTKNKSAQADMIQQLLSKKNISFKVCAMAMKHTGLDKSQLLPGVQIVPDGIYEIVARQHDGWGYIKH